MGGLDLILFRFTAPLHIGNVRADYDRTEQTLRSDALYSAIIQAWSILGIEHPILDCPPDSPAAPDLGFACSSLFPYFRAEKASNPILFFPKPMGALQPKNYKEQKKMKKIRFVDAHSFAHLLQNPDLPSAEDQINDKYYIDKAHNAIFNPDFMQRQIVPRSYVPRYGETDQQGKEVTETTIFYMERLYFSQYSGLFCLMQFDDDAIKNKVLAALQYLQDAGIGSDRNVGNGIFELSCQNFTAFDQLPDMGHEYATNLSLFCPESNEQLQTMLSGKQCAYSLIKRGGWITEDDYLSYRKNSVYMFGEGSIFSTNAATKGKTVNIRPKLDGVPLPPHPIFRVGRSLFLPIKPTQ